MIDKANKGYTALLRPHMETITRLAGKYGNPDRNRVEWELALKSEPELESTLLVGEGTREQQIKRLSAVWMRLRPDQKGRQTMFNGEQSLCSRLDDHRPAIEAMARANTNHLGRVSWYAGLMSSPDVADAIGYSALDTEGKRKFINVLGFWYRTRATPGQPKPAKQPAKLIRGENGYQAAPAPAPTQSSFCPRCGENLGAHALAQGIVASLSASGLSQAQIIQTLTHAANTITKLSQ